MNSAAKLKSIELALDEIEDCTRAHNHPGGATGLTGFIRNLSPELVEWGERTEYFEKILNSVNRTAEGGEDLFDPTLELQRKAEELQRKADKARYVLNLVTDDATMPPEATDASIRYVVEDEQLISSPLIYEALVHHAVHGTKLELEVRRLAWRRICQQRAQSEQALDAAPEVKWKGEELRRLREKFLRDRTTLGPRGSILKPAELYPGRSDLVPELLTELVSQAPAERNEIALTLGEIGGNEVAVFLADALRSEIAAGGVDENYQVYLASALSNIGGPDSVEGLLRAAEKGSERVRLVALSGLESLATAGAVALTEYPEPVMIDSEEMVRAYLRLAERLRTLAGESDTPPYVRHKAGELLDTILISLSPA